MHPSFRTQRDHDFTAIGGSATRVQRLEQASDIGRSITVRSDRDADVTLTLPVTTDCDDAGAIWTQGGRVLSNRNGLTVSISSG